jgi:hypothetical protein
MENAADSKVQGVQVRKKWQPIRWSLEFHQQLLDGHGSVDRR